MDKTLLTSDESWNVFKWILATLGGFIGLLTRLLFKNIIARLDDYFNAVKKNEEKIEKIANEMGLQISSIAESFTGLDMKFHAFKRQQEGVLQVALEDLETSRKQAKEDREQFLEIIKNLKPQNA